ncbi:MAG: hypothetical protein SGCHY_003473 [Lobulomycetales sp.]
MVYREQKSRSKFKVAVNLAFVAVFLTWGSGTLLYTVLLSTVLTTSNFIHIKNLLTATYFFTSYGFVLLVHYRFQTLMHRASHYPMAVDGMLFTLSSVVHFSYLSVTVLIDHCQYAGYGRLCSSALGSRQLLELYQSNGLILTLYSVMVDFILGSILIAIFFRIQRVKKALNTMKGETFCEAYSHKAKMAYACWAFMLVVLFALAFAQKFVRGVYETTHIANAMNAAGQLVNTLQYLAAFETLGALEFLLRLATNRLPDRGPEETSGDEFSVPDASSSEI